MKKELSKQKPKVKIDVTSKYKQEYKDQRPYQRRDSLISLNNDRSIIKRSTQQEDPNPVELIPESDEDIESLTISSGLESSS